MRAVLMDPAKSEEEKFAVWRDAMNPELSDEEVMDLMHKAEQRMKAMVKPKKGVAEAGSNAIDTVAKRLTDPKDGMSAKLRAAGDKRREDQLKGRNIAKRDTTSKDEWGNLKELSNDTLGRYKKTASADATAADKTGNFKRADKRFSGIVKATKKQFANDNKNAEEGIGSKLAGLGLAGAMALGAGGANARVVPGQDDPNINRLTGKPNVTQVAPSDAKPAVAEPTGFSKEWLQKAADPNRTGRYMISVEKAQELLSKMNAVDEAKKKGVAEDEKKGTKMKGNTRVNNCVPVSESVEDIIDSLINKIITNEATLNSGK
jgi:hypothetical protein